MIYGNTWSLDLISCNTVAPVALGPLVGSYKTEYLGIGNTSSGPLILSNVIQISIEHSVDR